MYLGIYTFLISGAAPSMLDIALEVASLKKVNRSWPMMRYTGKFVMPCPRMAANRVENTATITIFIKRGFRTLHNTPSTLRRYFSLKSRPIRFCKR